MPSLSPRRVFTGEEMLEDVTVHFDNGRVIDIIKAEPADNKPTGLLAPGFIDIQVNGGGGVLFNDNVSTDALSVITHAHRRFGVTGVMATLISDDRAKLAKALAVIDGASQTNPQHIFGIPSPLGLHLEGPWLSDRRRGVHPGKFLRQFDTEDLNLLTARRSFPLMVTVAPEQIDTASIKTLVGAGVRVSLGHTAAPADVVEAALAAGATCFTHLFNAMPPLENRKPGPVGVALGNRDCWAGLILDGIHVDPVSARAAFAAKGALKLILVSDAMATVGSSDPAMSLFGETIEVRDGALRTAAGTLAGAHLDLSGAVRNAVALLGATQEEALRMASLTPAEFLGVDMDRGRIAPGCRADFVLLDDDLNVRRTYVAGSLGAQSV